MDITAYMVLLILMVLSLVVQLIHILMLHKSLREGLHTVRSVGLCSQCLKAGLRQASTLLVWNFGALGLSFFLLTMVLT